YKLKVFELPEGGKNTKGRAIQNLLNSEAGDAVNAVISCKELENPEFTASHNLVFATRRGLIKKTSLAEYARVNVKGKKAIIIREGDQVIGVGMTDGDSEILLANRNGRAIRFHESKVRQMGRVSTGVNAMKLDNEEDEIIGLVLMHNNDGNNVMVISEKGYGKRSLLDDYRVTNRGGKGVKTMNVSERTGRLVSLLSVNDNNDLVIINKSGITLRLHVADLRVMGRATQGVRLINLDKRGDEIASVCCVTVDEEAETEEVETNPEELPMMEDTDAEPEIDEIDIEIEEESDEETPEDNE
ncbi:MAG: DNA gyrase subunit A, partial [Muribaculaceae bacterium]|nr:DNA gyrase subunit A [Muribaculaceae bacterium]